MTGFDSARAASVLLGLDGRVGADARALTEHLGIALEPGARLGERLAGTDRCRFDAAVLALGRDASSAVCVDDLSLAAATGAAVRVDAHLTRLELQGEPVLVCTLVERGELVRLRARVEALARSARDCTSRIAHDLGAPLRAIEHLARWIGEELGDGAPRGCEGHLRSLEERARHLRRLLSVLTEYACVEADAPCEGAAGTLDELVRATLDQRGDLPAPDLRVPAGLPPLLGEARRVCQVLGYLLENAQRHAPGSEVTVVGADAGDFVEVAVEDDGPGIAAERRAEAFALFHTTLPRFGPNASVGAGLALARRIVEAYGGTIRLESAASGGVRVCFRWPCARALRRTG